VFRALAFHDTRRIADGPLAAAALAARQVVDTDPGAHVLIFDAATSRRIELDFRGSWENLLERVATITEAHIDVAKPAPVKGPGRPRLGVVAREVTLLPRHWTWLNRQPGGASVTLRRLVEHARKSPETARKEAREVAYRFMSQMAGDLPGFEEASRALFGGNISALARVTERWPQDIHAHLLDLASSAR
jgi:hypothetical protein